VQDGRASIFTYTGRTIGRAKSRILDQDEYKAAYLYVLLNTIEVQPFVE